MNFAAQGWINCGVGSLQCFHFVGSQHVKDISATKSNLFQCFAFVAHSGSVLLYLWLTVTVTVTLALSDAPGFFRLTLGLPLALSGAHQLKRSFTAIAKVHLPWYRRCKVVFKWRFLETTIILNQSKIKSISFQCNGFDINSVKRLNLL